MVAQNQNIFALQNPSTAQLLHVATVSLTCDSAILCPSDRPDQLSFRKSHRCSIRTLQFSSPAGPTGASLFVLRSCWSVACGQGDMWLWWCDHLGCHCWRLLVSGVLWAKLLDGKWLSHSSDSAGPAVNTFASQRRQKICATCKSKRWRTGYSYGVRKNAKAW